MRFKRTIPHIGDTKVVRKFLWWPIRLTYRSPCREVVETRWLEWATIEYRFTSPTNDVYRWNAEWLPVRFL